MAFSNSNGAISGRTILSSMPNLPKSLAAVRAAVASILRPSPRSGSHSDADDVVNALNIVADAASSTSGATKVNVTLLLCAFANAAADGSVLAYDKVFGCHRDMSPCVIGPPQESPDPWA